MPHTASSSPNAASKRPLKSPLRASTMPRLGPAPVPEEPGGGQPGEAPESTVTAHQLRVMQISEFGAWLGTQTNKHKRPFQEETIRAYAETARALDLWMDESGIDGDFTACDTAVVDRFFAEYRNSHTQGGTNTRQRNLHTCSSGWRGATTTRTRGRATSSATGPSSHARPRSPRSSSGTCCAGRTAQGRPRVFRRAAGAAHDADRAGAFRLPAGPAVAQDGPALRAVAREPQPGADDRIRCLPDARPAGRGGGLGSAGGSSPYVPAYLRE
jgi:hypothetical protein